MKKQIKIIATTLAVVACSVVGVGQANADPAIMPSMSHVADANLELTVSAAQDSATLDWKTAEANQSVVITKDGIEIASRNGSGTLLDHSVHSGDEPVYAIEATKQATKSELLDSGFDGTNSELKSALPSAQATDVLSVQVGVPYPANFTLFGTPAQAATPALNNTTIRYQTFIHDAHVLAPYGCLTPSETASGNVYLFAGDNRSFDPTPGSSRTKYDVTADWNNGGNLSGYKNVGYTHKFVVTLFGLQEVSVDKASLAGITAKVTGESATVSSFHMHQNVENPFCLPGIANGIYVDYDFVLWKNGAYSMSGVALDAPDHELYTENDFSNSWKPIFQRVGNMACLVPNPFSSCYPYKAYSGVN